MFNSNNVGQNPNISQGSYQSTPNQPQSTQGLLQNQAVNVSIGQTSSLTTSVQQFTQQPIMLSNVTWQQAIVTAPQATPGMLVHPHFSAASAVADFLGTTIPLDTFAERLAVREAASVLQSVQGPSNSMLNQAFTVMLRMQIEARGLSLEEVRMTIEDCFPGLSPQQLAFSQNLTQMQVMHQLNAFFSSNPDVDRVMCEVHRADGNGQPSIEGLYREGTKWMTIGDTRPLPPPSTDSQNFNEDGSVKHPAAFFAMRHCGKRGGDAQLTGLTLLTLTPAQRRPQGASAAPQQLQFSMDTTQAEVARQLHNFFTANPDINMVPYRMHVPGAGSHQNPPIDSSLYRQGGKWWSQTQTQACDVNNVDIDGSVKDPAAFLALRHFGGQGGNPQQTGLLLLPLISQQQQSAQAGGVQQQLAPPPMLSNPQAGMSLQSAQPPVTQARQQPLKRWVYHRPGPSGRQIQTSTLASTSLVQVGTNSPMQVQFVNQSPLKTPYGPSRYQVGSLRTVNDGPAPVHERTPDGFRHLVKTSPTHQQLKPIAWAVVNFDHWLTCNPHVVRDPQSGTQRSVTMTSELASLPDDAWRDRMRAYIGQQKDILKDDILSHIDLLTKYRDYWRNGSLT